MFCGYGNAETSCLTRWDCCDDKVRAGESEAEADGYILTNPVSKTSMTSGLSREGKRQVISIPIRTPQRLLLI